MFSLFQFSLKTRIAIVAVVIAIGAGVGVYNKKQNGIYIHSPQVGDVYTVRLKSFISEGVKDSYPYGVLKVESIKGDEVDLNLASAQFGNIKSVNKSLRNDGKKADFYSGVLLHIPVAKLVSLLDSGDIVDVDR
jgi:hypothetical protein